MTKVAMTGFAMTMTSMSTSSTSIRSATPGGHDFLASLKERGLFYQCTDEQGLRDHAVTPGRVAYAGFDPTSDSLTIGNLVPIRMLMLWQHAGHAPIALVGGGTGLVGDPSGRDDERSLMTREQVEANVASQQRIFERLLDFSPAISNPATIVNNVDWLGQLGFLEMLRDVGKHFSINEMIQRDSVRKRLEEREHGISFTEFSYMLLQAYDFLHLRKTVNCTVQMAGSDQYGNILSGIDLIRRELGEHGRSFGVTAPLVTRSDGKKMSKSTGGAIWLSADTEKRTSPYEFYQYWINLPDADAVPWLKLYTPMTIERIEEIAQEHEAAPHERAAQRELARAMTALVHGPTELERVETATEALFSGEVRTLDEATLREVFADVPSSQHAKSDLGGAGASLVDVLPQTSLAGSKREAREFLANGALSVNGEKAELDRALMSSDLLPGDMILLRRGKKHWHATRWG